MASKKVVDYIRGLLQKGYDISLIRNTMLRYGYTNKDIDEAVNEIYNPTIRHEIHLGKTTIFALAFIVLSITGIVLFFYYSPPKGPAKLLDVNLEPVKTEAAAGESITFLKELSNLGSSKRYDVTVKQEIIDPQTSKVITEKTETRAIETFGSTQTSINIPAETRPGNYILRAIVEYDGKRAVATLPIKIRSAAKGSCFDGIKNQNEEGIDCGGVCVPCRAEILDCDDNNPCTEDFEDDGSCATKPIAPCCGNNICEENEICALDCEQPEEITTINIDEIKETAKSNPSKALQDCSSIEVPDLKDTCFSNIAEVQRNKNYCGRIASVRIKDLCYSNIAKSSNDNSVCQDISGEGIRDSCYANFFVPPNKDYSVCDKIVNPHLKRSCDSLRQLNEFGQQ